LCSFSPTDLGVDGILSFFDKHRCGDYCRQDWAMPRSRSLGRIPIQRGTLMEDYQKHAPSLEDRQPLSKKNGGDLGHMAQDSIAYKRARLMQQKMKDTGYDD